VAQVVLHLGTGELRPEIVNELDELRGNELCLIGGSSFQEVEAARMGAVGQTKDMDPLGMPCRDAFEDVRCQIAVRVDDRGARASVQDSEGQLRDERALA
jgi:hypothetical protein